MVASSVSGGAGDNVRGVDDREPTRDGNGDSDGERCGRDDDNDDDDDDDDEATAAAAE